MILKPRNAQLCADDRPDDDEEVGYHETARIAPRPVAVALPRYHVTFLKSSRAIDYHPKDHTSERASYGRPMP